MKTADIEYNGQIFSCRTIIDISSIVELLGLLAKRQQYLEDKLNFQEERINDKDKRISELELMIKGVSLSKEEKFPSEKEIPVIKKEIKNDLDDDLDAFLNNDNKVENKSNNINEIKQETKEDNNDLKEEKSEENGEERSEEKSVEKVEEKEEKKVEEKPEEKVKEKYEEKAEEKSVEKKEKNDENKNEENIENKNGENKEDKNDGDVDNNINDKEEIENKININFEQKQSPTIVTKQNLSNTENNQATTPKSPEKKETNIEKKTNTINFTETNTTQNQNLPQGQSQNSQNDEILKKIVKKIKLLESKIDKLQQNELVGKSQSISQEKANKSRLENRINLLNNKIDQLEDDQKKMKEDISKIKEKTDDFNVYDLFKGNTGDTNIDAAKGLIMNLENKIYKKLGLYDLKFKKDEEEIFQNKNDIKNMNNIINGLKETCAKNTKDINDLKQNNEDKYVEINKFISEINNKIKDIDTKMNTNVPSNIGNIISSNDNNKESANNNNPVIISTTSNNNDLNQINEKMKELENKISKLSEELESIKSSNNKDSKEEKTINPEQLKLIKDISTRTNELEKHMKIILSQLNIKEVYERLDALEKDLNKKGNKLEISELKEKLLTLEEDEKDLNFKMDQMQQFTEKIRGDMQQIVKKIEYLSGQLNRISNENADNDKNKGPILDVNKFVDMYLFNEKQKEINKKFDKIRLSFEEVARNIDDIIQKLSHVPSDKDFSQFQSIIRAMIDDLKLGLNKKYAEKTETTKSIKFLETQIKTIQESFQKKMEGADNWLLAKKPLNNYVCASCESIIKGELGKKSEFVPWNKYPNREEKSYRFGHGFSRMLQLINEDKKREVKEKDSMSDGGSDSEPMLKLPKLKRLHINSSKLKNNYNNNAISDDENNVPYEKNRPYNDLDPILTEERPKIMKIVKRSKNVVGSSYLNRLDKQKDKDKENPPNFIVKTVPNNPKEGNQIGSNEVNNNNNE